MFNRQESKYESVCLKVKGVLRDLYFVPKIKVEPSNTEYLHRMDEEIKAVLERTYQSRDFSFKRKPVEKNYCFELDLPPQQVYLNVRYGFEHRPLNLNVSG